MRKESLSPIALIIALAGMAASAAAQDVTSPGDPVSGSSENYPGAEDPSKVLDNLGGTKYLNFDEIFTGFTVLASRADIVRGLIIVTANDAPDRDPTSFLLEGSDDGVNFVLVAQGALNPPTARYGMDQVSFNNSTSYTYYRVTFPTVRNSNAANSMQVGEVQLVTGTDILTPGDAFTVTYTAGASSPNNEGPGSLFDNRLNTKLGIFSGDLGPTVIDVTPGVGSSVVTGFDLFGAGDDAAFPGRTPSYVAVYGSNDGVSFTELGRRDLESAFANFQEQDLRFANTTAYTRYRIEFGPSLGDTFLQIGEIQLYGSVSNAPPANDNCANAQPVLEGTTAGSNFNATGEASSSCGTADQKDVWYRYVATSTGPVEINTIGAGVIDTTLAVYTACGGSAIACNDNARGGLSRVTINAQANQGYLIRVAGNNDSTGSFTLNVDTSPVAHTDVLVPLTYNFNGMVHTGEDNNPDSESGYRSIGDRGMRLTGAVGSLEVGLEGATGIPYTVVTQAGVLDMVHLGDRNTVDNGFRAFDLEIDGDETGIQPLWLPDSNQSGPQTTDTAALGAAMQPGTQIGVLFNASNGGTTFDMTIGFSDGSTAVVQLDAPDWYGQQDVDPALAGVESQQSLGTFISAEFVDAGTPGVDLNVVEAVVSHESLIAGGLGDFAGRQITSISFSNAQSTVPGIGIYAVTVRDPGQTCRADFNGDDFLDFFDYGDYVFCFETGECPPGKTADFNGDDFVDFFDYLDFVTAFETGC
jgi:hypothetical protein